MSKILGLREKAKTARRKIVLPEGDDIRTIKAASFIASEGIADVIMLGDIPGMRKKSEEGSVSLDKVKLIDPQDDEIRDKVIEAYHELRKYKGVTPEDARETVLGKYVFFGAVMCRMGLADGFVCGAVHSTADVTRAAIQCIKMDKAVGTIASSFVMELSDCDYGEEGLFVYADCGVIPYPSSKQLSGIAIGASDLFKKLFDVEPRTAMLSFSTKGSAEGPSIDLVREALAKVKEKRPDISVDGELQVDSAIVPDVAKKKCGDSEVAGKANVFIFPSLDAGNIAYKITERLAKAKAIGPLFHGLEQPCSDLSRGCGWEDIVDAVAITAVRGQKK